MSPVKTFLLGLLPTLGVGLGLVLLNEHGFLEFAGGKSRAQGKIDHPPKA